MRENAAPGGHIGFEAAHNALDLAAFEPRLWEPALKTVGDALGSKHFAIIRMEKNHPQLLSATGKRHFENYCRGAWSECDLRAMRIMATPADQIVTDHVLVSDEERLASDFYRGFAASEDVPYCISWRVQQSDESVWFTSMRSRAAGPPRQEDMAAAREIAGRVSAAFRLSANAARYEASGLLQGLTASNECAIVLGSAARVLGMTPSAEKLLGDELNVRDGVLTSSLSWASKRIYALSLYLAGISGDATPFRISLPDQASITCTPLPNAGAGLDIFGGVRCILFLQHRSGRRSALQTVLTRAESEVAEHVAQGRSLAEISELRGVSVGTTRTILRSVFSKTGTHRQNELAAFVRHKLRR